MVASSFTQSVPIVAAAAAGTALAVWHPAARRPENVLGVGVGAAAVAVGIAAPQAVAMGLGVAAVSRIPLVQSAAMGTINVLGSIAETSARAAVWTAETAVSAVDKTLSYVVIPIVEGGANLTGKAIVGTAECAAKVGSFAVNTIGSILSGVDAALDKVTFQK
jgi:hypothetical protein